MWDMIKMDLCFVKLKIILPTVSELKFPSENETKASILTS